MASRTVAQLEAKLKRFFVRDPRFRLVTKLPGGATGECLLYEERDSVSRTTRKLVLKYPNDDDEDILDALKNEIKWIEVLRFSEHIVNPISIQNGPNQGTTGLDRIFILMEFVPNGTLNRFMQRTRNITLPNRILWSLLLCLTRACVAMAWPAEQGQVEEPKPNVQPLALRHGDMHDKNLLFGDLGPQQEHTLVPILKFIDFDNATIVTNEAGLNPDAVEIYDEELELERYQERAGVRNFGMNANVLDIGITLTRVVARNRILNAAGCRRFIDDEHPLLDDDLKLLICRCLAVDPNNRPKLDELLRKSLDAVLSKRYAGTPYDAAETDENIRSIVQRIILNA